MSGDLGSSSSQLNIDSNIKNPKIKDEEFLVLSGFNTDVDISDAVTQEGGLRPFDITEWYTVSTTKLFPTSITTQIYVSSSNVNDIHPDNNDGASSVGAFEVFIKGIDLNGREVSETIKLNGQTSVNTTQDYIRINSIEITYINASETKAAGDIYIGAGTNTSGVPATILSKIRQGYQDNQNIFYSVPEGKYLEVWKVTVLTNASVKGTLELATNKIGNGLEELGGAWQGGYLFKLLDIYYLQDTTSNSWGEVNYTTPLIVDELHDLTLRVIALSASNTEIRAMVHCRLKSY